METTTVKYEMNEHYAANERNIKQFMVKKYLLENLTLVLLLTALGVFRYLAYINDTTVSTILGALVGYFAKDIRKINT